MTDKALFRKGEIARVIYDAAGGANSPMREPITVQLGNPNTGDVYVPDGIRQYEGQVWLSDRVGDFPQVDTDDTDRDDSPGGLYMGFLPSGAIPSGKRKFGTTVKAVWTNGRYEVLKETIEGATYNRGVPENEQSPIKVKEFDYGLMRPTDPPSGRVVISDSIHPGATNWELLVLKLSADLIATHTPNLTPGQALAVKIESDPSDNSITYTAGSAFTSTARDSESGAVDHAAVFSNYPRTVDSDLKLHGWVYLYTNQLTITEQDLLVVPDYGGSGAGGGGGASALDDLTDVTIASPLEGHVVYYNGSAWVNRYAWDGFLIEGPNAITSIPDGDNADLDFLLNYDSGSFYNEGSNILTLPVGVWDLKAHIRFEFDSALTSAGYVYFSINGTFSGSANTQHETFLQFPTGTALVIAMQAVAGGYIGSSQVFSVNVINGTDQDITVSYCRIVGDRHRP